MSVVGSSGARRTCARWVLAAAVSAVALGAAAAETLVVRSAEVKVRAEQRSLSPLVATVRQGESIEVVGREGKWLRVNVNGQQGWVYEDALASGSTASAATGGVLNAMGSDASSMSASAAAKGIDAFDLAESRGQSTAGLEKLLALNGRVSFEQTRSFMAEGNVGSARKK